MSNAFKTRTLDLTTGTKEAVADITDDCAAFLRDVANGADGLLNV
ncbi:YjbQ family protein, partial [Streptomyces rimosus]